MGGYASLRTSDSDLSEKDSAQAMHGSRRQPYFWSRGLPLLALHGMLLMANIIVAVSYHTWHTAICAHGPQNENCAFTLL
jgi:hypothetical protein